MALGDNRIKVTGSDGKTYWYNPHTNKLFRSKTSKQVVKDYTYNPSLGVVYFPGSKGYIGNTTVGGGGSGKTLPENPALIDGPKPGGDPSAVDEDVEDPTEEVEDPEVDEDTEEVPEEPDTGAAEDLFFTLNEFLSKWGLEGLAPFVRDAISQGKSYNQILLELRDHPVYVQRFAGLVQLRQQGIGGFTEADYISFEAQTNALSKSYGFGPVTSSYIASAFAGQLSVAEIEHRFQINQQVQRFGPGVRFVLEQELGRSLTDDEIFEFFDPSISTAEFDEAYLNALYRGRPFALGLGVRSQAEADALKMLGVDPDEAFQRYEQLGFNTSRFQRLASIQSDVVAGLPEDFGSFLQNIENELLVDAFIFQRPDALEKIQNLSIQEAARFKSGGGAVSSGTQAVGLQTQGQRSGTDYI